MPGTRTEVAEDLAFGELLVDGRELVDVDGDGAAAPLRVAGARDAEAGRVGEGDQQVGLSERIGADPLDADLFDQVVAGGGRVERRNVRRAGEEARRAGGVAHLLLERERRLVGLPARVARLEQRGEIGPNVEPAVARPAAEPLDRAADGEVDVQGGHVERDDAGGLVGVEDHVRAGLVGTLDDPVRRPGSPPT